MTLPTHIMNAALLAAGCIIEKEKRKVMLYPDMTREQYEGSETFVFAAPCTKDEWYRMKALSCDDGDHLPYLFSEDHDEMQEQVCIVLRFPESIDDHAVETAAWIRIKHEFNGMIYAMKYDPQPPDYGIAATIARTAGAPPNQVRHIELPKPKNLGV